MFSAKLRGNPHAWLHNQTPTHQAKHKIKHQPYQYTNIHISVRSRFSTKRRGNANLLGSPHDSYTSKYQYAEQNNKATIQLLQHSKLPISWRPSFQQSCVETQNLLRSSPMRICITKYEYLAKHHIIQQPYTNEQHIFSNATPTSFGIS